MVLPEFSRPAEKMSRREFALALRPHTYEHELEAFARKKRRERRGKRAHFLKVKEVARARLAEKKGGL